MPGHWVNNSNFGDVKGREERHRCRAVFWSRYPAPLSGWLASALAPERLSQWVAGAVSWAGYRQPLS